MSVKVSIPERISPPHRGARSLSMCGAPICRASSGLARGSRFPNLKPHLKRDEQGNVPPLPEYLCQ